MTKCKHKWKSMSSTSGETNVGALIAPVSSPSPESPPQPLLHRHHYPQHYHHHMWTNAIKVIVSVGLLLCATIVVCESSTAAHISGHNNGGHFYPNFDAQDLANLVEMFPEFREYVYQVLLTQANSTTAAHQSGNSGASDEDWQMTALRTLLANKSNNNNNNHNNNYGKSVGSSNGDTSSSDNNGLSRKDWGWGWGGWSKPEVIPTKGWGSGYSKYEYGYPAVISHSPNHEYGKPSYGYQTQHNPYHGWGWEKDEYKNPKFHYEVGYNLGKDLSCLFGLLGFKSLKDITIHSVFSFFKKLKYLVLIALAFKLGVILSPVALPLLFPVIILAVIAKILPLLLIIVLLFKLLKAQVKLKGGREEAGEARGYHLMHVSRLWESIEDVTEKVARSDECVERIVCTIRSAKNGNGGESRGLKRFFVNAMTEYLPSILSWLYPSIRWRTAGASSNSQDGENNFFTCKKIECSSSTIIPRTTLETPSENTTVLTIT